MFKSYVYAMTATLYRHISFSRPAIVVTLFSAVFIVIDGFSLHILWARCCEDILM